MSMERALLQGPEGGTMRVCLAALFAAIAIGAKGDVESDRFRTWTQVRDGAVWTLAATVEEITGPYGWPGELVRFTVRRDGKFLACASSFDGGRLAGMKRYFGGPSEFKVEDLLPEAGAGWILYVAESTGSAFSMLACVITPGLRGHDGYESVVVPTKQAFRQRACAEGVDLWGSYQEWGDGGTASSVFVPFRLVARRRGLVSRKPLPGALSELVDPDEAGFGGAFVAGIREGNPDLMQDALDRLHSDPDEAGPRLTSLGLPARRADLRGVIANVRERAESGARLGESLGGIAVEDPLRPGVRCW